MRALILGAVALAACASAGVPGSRAPLAVPCPEPPPPPPAPSLRAAAAFFELTEVSRWADEQLEAPAQPTVVEVVERLRAVVEAIRSAEEAAAAARAYDVAESARMDGDDLVVRLIELGVDVSPEARAALALGEGDDPVAPDGDPVSLVPGVLDDLAMTAGNAQEIAIQVAEREALTAVDGADRARASCLVARLGVYVDLEGIAEMLEQDAVELRIAAQQGAEPEEREELDAIERQLVLTQAILAGVRRGAVQTVDAVGPAFQLSSTAADAAELQDLANELIDACRASATFDRARPQ
jgi:hypothetical protein